MAVTLWSWFLDLSVMTTGLKNISVYDCCFRLAAIVMAILPLRKAAIFVTRGCPWLIYPSVPLVNFLSVLSHFLSLFPDNSCQYAPDTKLPFTPLLLCRASSDHWLPERSIFFFFLYVNTSVKLMFYVFICFMDNPHSVFMACWGLNALKYELGVILHSYDIRFPPSLAGSVYSEISRGFCFLFVCHHWKCALYCLKAVFCLSYCKCLPL